MSASTPTPTKDQLKTAITQEWQHLEDVVAKLEPRQLTQAGVTEAGWSAKDILAHLAAWEQLFLGWYAAGLRGETPQTPAPGYTWSAANLHKLNEKIYRKYRRMSLTEIRRLCSESHQQLLAAFADMTEEDLSQPNRFAWTGKGALAGAVTANTWRHYRWGRTLIDKWRKAQKRAAKQRAT